MDAATVLTIAAIAAFAPAAMLALGVIAFIRTTKLRAALAQAYARIQALEAALSAGGIAPPPQQAPQAAPQPTFQPAPQPPPVQPAPQRAPVLTEAAPPPPQMASPTTPEPATAGALAVDWPAIGVASALTLAFFGVWGASQSADPPLVTAPIALGLMAGIGVTALGLSLRFGPWFVLLGLALSYLAPALATLAQPAPAALFAYLFAVAAAALGIIARAQWRLLPWFAIGGALAWPALWLAIAFTGAAQWALTAYLIGIAGLGVAYAWRDAAAPDAIRQPSEAVAVSLVATVGAGLALLAATHMTGHALAPMSGLIALACAAIALACQREGLTLGALAAGALALGALLDWPALPPANGAGAHLVLGVDWLVNAGGVLGFAASTGGWLMMARHRHPGYGAALAALGPPSIIAALFWKSDGFGPAWAWGGAALALAILLAFTLAQIAKRAGGAANAPGSTAAFALGAALSAAFAAVFTTSGFPLAAALALIAPVCAWLDRQFAVNALKIAAIVIAGTVVLLLAPPIAFFHPVSPAPLLNLMGPSYVIAAAALFVAARLFDQTVGRDDTRLVQSLEAAGLLLCALLLSMQVRHLANGGALAAPYATLAEVGGHTLAWLALALALAWRFGPQPRPLLYVAEAIAFGAALANVAAMGLVVLNPWWGMTPASAPGWPVANALALAFGAPALALTLYAALRHAQGMRGRAAAATVTACVLAFVNVTLEARRAAHGGLDLQAAPIGLVEGWTMTAGWGALAALLLGLAAWRASRLLTFAALTVAAAAAIKGFTLDAPALDGIAQPLAFFALAAATLGAGYVFYRMLGPQKPGPAYRAAVGDPNLSPPQDVR